MRQVLQTGLKRAVSERTVMGQLVAEVGSCVGAKTKNKQGMQ